MNEENNPAQASLLDGVVTKYCADANTFFEFWLEGRKFPVMLFGPLWQQFSTHIEQRVITSVEEVYLEIKDFNNEQFQKWLRPHKSMLFIENDNRVTQLAAKILNDHPEILFQKNKNNGGDAFLVAAAIVYDLTVITEESKVSVNRLKSGECPRIPNLCEEYGAKPAVNILGYCEHEGITFDTVRKSIESS